MQNAVKFDQGVIKEDGEVEYTDAQDVTMQPIEHPKPKEGYTTVQEVQEDLLRGAITKEDADKLIAGLNKK